MIEHRSPFPGMDPYLEEHWRDVHHRLCTYAADFLQPQLRPKLLARVEERLLVETDIDDPRSIYPDVKVVQRRSGPRSAPAEPEGAVALADPLIVYGESEPAFEGFIQIIDTATGGKLVTVIEFLSPSNKYPGDGQRLYRQKQSELAEARVSLVEIDLLRGGQYIVQTRRDRVPSTPYRVSIHRGWKEDEFEYYPIYLNERLPTIRIPLRSEDKDARLDLQALIDQTYVNGAYDLIDYGRPLAPPLLGEELAWAERLLRGRRAADSTAEA